MNQILYSHDELTGGRVDASWIVYIHQYKHCSKFIRYRAVDIGVKSMPLTQWRHGRHSHPRLQLAVCRNSHKWTQPRASSFFWGSYRPLITLEYDRISVLCWFCRRYKPTLECISHSIRVDDDRCELASARGSPSVPKQNGQIVNTPHYSRDIESLLLKTRPRYTHTL